MNTLIYILAGIASVFAIGVILLAFVRLIAVVPRSICERKKRKRLNELVQIRKNLIYEGCWDGMSCENCKHLYTVRTDETGRPVVFSCLREDSDDEILKIEGLKREQWRHSNTLIYLDKFEMEYYDEKHPEKKLKIK